MWVHLSWNVGTVNLSLRPQKDILKILLFSIRSTRRSFFPLFFGGRVVDHDDGPIVVGENRRGKIAVVRSVVYRCVASAVEGCVFGASGCRKRGGGSKIRLSIVFFFAVWGAVWGAVWPSIPFTLSPATSKEEKRRAYAWFKSDIGSNEGHYCDTRVLCSMRLCGVKSAHDVLKFMPSHSGPVEGKI